MTGLAGCAASLEGDDRAQAATAEVVLERAPGSALAHAIVSVADTDGAPIVGLDVVGAFHGTVELPVAAVTDADGAIVFSARTPANADISFELAALGSRLVSRGDYRCPGDCRLDAATPREKDGVVLSDFAEDEDCEEDDATCGIATSDLVEEEECEEGSGASCGIATSDLVGDPDSEGEESDNGIATSDDTESESALQDPATP